MIQLLKKAPGIEKSFYTAKYFDCLMHTCSEKLKKYEFLNLFFSAKLYHVKHINITELSHGCSVSHG